ncbi:hypothetical protein [Kitasatospora sp. NPDC089509]|uniref:hypothetical protein n=1 Tax=Kitasatospora sp. NPDC089509 TaxID=3364079 RepID=UPI00381499A1
MKLSKLAQVFGWQPATGHRRRTAPNRSKLAVQQHHATDQDVFARTRPWAPPEPYWCTMTAYYRFGQPITLWSGGTGSVRLAVRALRDRVDALAAELRLPEDDDQLLSLDVPSAEGRAADDLTKGRSHAIAITYGDVVYIISATPTLHSATGPRPPQSALLGLTGMTP